MNRGQHKKINISNNRGRSVECYDCHKQVIDLKSHRQVCENSRYTKSFIHLSEEKKNTTSDKFKNTTDFYFLLDVSGSMVGKKLEDVKETVIELVNKLNNKDRLAVITFDSSAFFKIKPRSVGQIIRQNELPSLFNRIFSDNNTAIWDAIYLAVSQLRDKERKTVITVLTDGEDNSSKHSYNEVRELIDKHNNITLDIIHIGENKNNQYEILCQGRGTYTVITEIEIK